MKQITTITLITLTISLISGCSSKTEVAPSQNSALNSISSSGQNSKSSYMQKSLDSWLKEDWTPTVTKDKEVQKKYMKKTTVSKNGESNETVENKSTQSKTVQENGTSDEGSYVEDKDRNFTLQEYVDKAEAYFKAKPHDYENSNVKKLEEMPIIGK